MASIRVLLSLCLGFGAVACGDDSGDGPDPDGATMCATDADCDDGSFCTGLEACDPESPAANDRGCIPGTPPCPASSCEEASRTCDGECPDLDGDGFESVECGGDDCDDADAEAYPGATEICDSEGRDEDCDPTTFGTDADGDGYFSDECCQRSSSGSVTCGADCNDDSMEINPEAVDACGSGDEDCDGDIDEEPELTFYRDIDGDGYGVPDDTVMACGAPGGYALLDTDCNDMVAATNPAATERCDVSVGETPDPMIHDQDCDGAVDEGCACMEGAEMDCGSAQAMAMTGTCRPGTQTCETTPSGTEWGSCDSIEPNADEVCDGADDDCDGSTDEAFDCERLASLSGPTACGSPNGTRRCSDSCTWIDSDYFRSETGSTCNYCDDTGGGISAELANATGSTTRSLYADGTRYGAAGEFDEVPWLLSAPSYGTAASIVAPPTVAGHGTITMTATMRVGKDSSATPGEGWAIFLVETGASTPLGPASSGLGVPRDRDGFSAEWQFNQNASDRIVIRRLRESSSLDSVVDSDDTQNPSLNGATSGTVNQGMRVVVTPDRVDTIQNETAVTVFNTTWFDSETAVCGPSASTSCPFRITPGTEYLFGVSAATHSSRDANVLVDQGSPTATFTQQCP